MTVITRITDISQSKIDSISEQLVTETAAEKRILTLEGKVALSRTSSKSRAAERARWLTELSRAIDDAQHVAWRLGVAEGRNRDAMELYGRLETARTELEALRRSNWANRGGDVHSKWIEILPVGFAQPKWIQHD